MKAASRPFRHKKSRHPFPGPDPPSRYDFGVEAAKGRRQLYVTTLVYAPPSVALMGFLLERPTTRPAAAIAFALGLLMWPLVEYLFHRYVLHGVFPDGPGWRGLLHRHLDEFHWAHHAHPWDGDRLAGSVRDTLPLAVLLTLLSLLLAPWPLGPAFMAAILVGYVLEEWAHYAVHFHNFRGRYFQTLKRHHAWHHSRVGSGSAFGLSNWIWDRLLRTSAPHVARTR
jgi:sterol desaturase/sphingolipid hydroxylase (fatty acid hydroxylase superfamily)